MSEQTPEQPSTTPNPALQRQRASQLAQALRSELQKALIGQGAVIDDVLTALLAGGHVLVEGVPGLGKTLLVRALARCFDGGFARIQFTPDLMPSDVTGHAVYDLASEQFKLRKGPVFTHLLLADEINRAPAKTQAALLEVMQERQVTLEGRALLALFAVLLLLAIGLGSLSALGQRLPAQLHTFWWAALAALLLLGLLDALWARRQPVPKLSRQLSGNLPLGRWSEVRLHLQHTYRRPVRLTLFDHLPAGMDFEYLPQEVELRPGESTEVGYRVRPLNRGHFVFPRCELELPSPLRLWRQRRYLEARGETRVYPYFARLYGAELMAVDHWLNQIGVRGGQRRGLGLEFHQLREFRDGDTLRQIDWKATARKRTPIAREYQDERDQQILFLLDCGRRMRSQDGDLSHFDHALNASLLLAYVALRQGDAVGAMTFAGDDRRHLPPGKGSAQLGALLNTVYDLQTSQRPADFPEAVQAVLSRQRRRALVILVTNLRDEDDEELLGAVKRLGRQHRVLVASLREEVLDTLRQEPVARYEQALAYTGTIDYLNARNGLHEKLAAHGVPVLDARPSELGPELISRYLGWKRAGVL